MHPLLARWRFRLSGLLLSHSYKACARIQALIIIYHDNPTYFIKVIYQLSPTLIHAINNDCPSGDVYVTTYRIKLMINSTITNKENLMHT